MTDLTLVQSTQFGSVAMDVYRDGHEVWLTRDQIGTALGYTDPRVAIAKIHDRHRDRLDRFSGVTKVVTPGGQQETVVYSARGVYEICRWSQQPKANAFFDWVYDLLEGLRTGAVGVVSPEADVAALKRRHTQTLQARELRRLIRDGRDLLPHELLQRLATEAATALLDHGWTPPERPAAPKPKGARSSRRQVALPAERTITARSLRYWREERRWTQKDLGAAIGLSPSGVVYLEQGKRPIKTEVLIRIADVLQVEVAQFFREPPGRHSGQLKP